MIGKKVIWPNRYEFTPVEEGGPIKRFYRDDRLLCTVYSGDSATVLVEAPFGITKAGEYGWVITEDEE